ncbi:hypothetical protein L7F22_059873 [Adiantum nelumboides]|nr:hypothetical protein [Adiantum nelumboides]
MQLQARESNVASIGCYQSSGKVKQVQFAEDDEEYQGIPRSHYSRTHWARATTETLVKIGELEEPVVALIDHGSEINIMSKNLYNKCKWPMDTEHGWMVNLANNSSGELYAACPSVKVIIGDVKVEQNFFIQDTSSYHLILGQPYIVGVRMETKGNDGFWPSTIVKRDCSGTRGNRVSHGLQMDGAFSSSSLATSNGSFCFTKLEDLKKCDKQYVRSVQLCMKEIGLLESNENVLGLFEQVSFVDTMSELDAIVKSTLQLENEVVEVCSIEMYQAIEAFKEEECPKEEIGPEVHVETKYKNVAKKVKPVASPLPPNNREKIEQASLQPSLRNPKMIEHKFTQKSFKELQIGCEGFLTLEEKKCWKVV